MLRSEIFTLNLWPSNGSRTRTCNVRKMSRMYNTVGAPGEFYPLTLNITRVVWPHVTNVLDLRYFCRHDPLFCRLNLIPWHYWGWQKNIYFLVNIFVRHTFSMSKSSIKTETVLTMTDMRESTELLAFKRQKDCYKVTVKIFLCNFVVLSWDELKVRQNLFASDYEIYIVCLTVATFYWHIEA